MNFRQASVLQEVYESLGIGHKDLIAGVEHDIIFTNIMAEEYMYLDEETKEKLDGAGFHLSTEYDCVCMFV